MKTYFFLLAGFAASFTTVGEAAPVHFEGFEDPAWVAGQPDNWVGYLGGSIERVVSGTNGITSSSGVAHAELSADPPTSFNPSNDAANGPFTRFGGYSTEFHHGFIASLDVYLDPSWDDGRGFDYSVAANRQDNTHLRDFIWHVGVVNGDLLVNASNNSDWQFNAWKLENENSGNNYTVTSEGWYTLEHVFYEDAGNLAVDFNFYDDQSDLLHSITRNTTDDIATVVGGNRYGWMVFNNIDGLAIDNTSLQIVPETGTLALAGIGLLGLIAWAYRRRRSR